MSDFIEFDCSPSDEDCVSVQRDVDYFPAMRAEANRMLELLAKRFPDVPGYFCTKRQEHDFGPYLEIRYRYEDEDSDSMNFVESNWPQTWEDSTPVLFKEWCPPKPRPRSYNTEWTF